VFLIPGSRIVILLFLGSGTPKLSEHHQGQLNVEGQPSMEGLITIVMAVAFPDFLFSHSQASRSHLLLSDLTWTEQISARKVQLPSVDLLSTSLTVPLELGQGRGYGS
jgi:hypothetical protein